MPPVVVLVVLMTALRSPRVLATKKVKVFDRRDANPYKEDNYNDDMVQKIKGVSAKDFLNVCLAD